MTTRANCTRSENVRPSANVFANSTNEPPSRSPLRSLYRIRSATERRIGLAGSGVASERTGTAAVGDSGKASMSVASTGLGERGGVLGGVMLHMGDRISGRDDATSTAGASGPKLSLGRVRRARRSNADVSRVLGGWLSA